MRSWVFAWVGCLVGCAPQFGDFKVVDGDGGHEIDNDASTSMGHDSGMTESDSGMHLRDGGSDSECSTLLGCHRDCRALLQSVLFTDNFEGGIGDLQGFYGDADVVHGELVAPAPQETFIAQSLSAFRGVVACATFRTEPGSGAGEQQLSLGLRAPESGVNVWVESGAFKLFGIEPDTNTLIARQDYEWQSGLREFRVLLYFDEAHAYSEIDDGTSVAVLRGAYGGVEESINVKLEADSLVHDFHIDDMIAGPPTTRTLSVLTGE